MLRPSAFQNNGRASETETASSSRSILRPSSFQLAPSTLAAANNCNNKTECNNEPSTTSPSDTPFEVKEAKQSTSVDSDIGSGCSSSGGGGSGSGTANTSTTSVSASNEGAKEDDSKISSTTNNDGENNGEHSDEAKVITNPFNSRKIKDAELDEENETEAKPKSKPDTDDDNQSDASKSDDKSGDLPGKGLFASTTKNLFAAAASKAPTMNNGSESNFVFGQNIRERIVGVPDTSGASADSENQSGGSKLFAMSGPSTGESSSAGSSTNGAEAKESSTVENLTKVAREYEESRVQKRKLDAVETFTGEENESNILDVSCKLFAFVASNWEQRGPGSLRLNDVNAANEDARSRLVFRTLGNFRVLLNTKVWGGMVVEKPSQKSLRLTAIDANDGAVKIYLVMARPDDISILYSALKKRIDSERKREKTVESTTSLDSMEANTSKRSHHDDDDDSGEDNDEEPDAKKDRTI